MSADDLRTMRHRMKWTQRQLAEKLGVTRCTVSRWEMAGETYKIPPIVEKLVMLLVATG